MIVSLIEWSVRKVQKYVYVCTYLEKKTEKRKYFVVRTQLYDFCEVNELSTKVKVLGRGICFLRQHYIKCTFAADSLKSYLEKSVRNAKGC